MQLADRMGRVNLQLHMQAVVGQEHGPQRFAVGYEPLELGWIRQGCGFSILKDGFQRRGIAIRTEQVVVDIPVRTLQQGEGLVQELLRPGHHRLAPGRVVFGPLLQSLRLRYDVGAVQGVVQAAPARVGRVQGITGVVHRHHQLWARHACDFRVHVGGGDRIVVGFRLQIADFLQELPLFVGLEPLGAPLIDSALKIVPLFEERSVQGRQILNDGGQRGPERVRVDAGPRCDFIPDQVIQPFVDAKTAAGDATVHAGQGSLCAGVTDVGLAGSDGKPDMPHAGAAV